MKMVRDMMTQTKYHVRSVTPRFSNSTPARTQNLVETSYICFPNFLVRTSTYVLVQRLMVRFVVWRVCIRNTIGTPTPTWPLSTNHQDQRFEKKLIMRHYKGPFIEFNGHFVVPSGTVTHYTLSLQT